MKQELLFDDEHEFLDQLKELIRSGVPPETLRAFTPVPVKEVDEILKAPRMAVRMFAVAGAVAGCIAGLALTIYTVLSFPLVTGGKELISTLPFLIIAFELTILFGALATFAGFLLLSRLPNILKIIEPVDYGNHFVIVVQKSD